MARKVYTKEFKTRVVLEAIVGSQSMSSLAQKYGIHPGQIQAWKTYVLKNIPNLFEKPQKAHRVQETLTEALERKIGQLTMENEFFKKKFLTFPGPRGCK